MNKECSMVFRAKSKQLHTTFEFSITVVSEYV
jgi:hypothetical protein